MRVAQDSPAKANVVVVRHTVWATEVYLDAPKACTAAQVGQEGSDKDDELVLDVTYGTRSTLQRRASRRVMVASIPHAN